MMADQGAPTSLASSSSRPPLDGDDLICGAESGWVEARTSCDHLNSSLSPDLTHIPPPDTSCQRCDHPEENWVCLSCKEVLCSRFVNKHMLQHYQETNHCVALSYSDLSVWCFACEAYLDAQVISDLRPAHETAYILKFGEAPPVRENNNHVAANGETSDGPRNYSMDVVAEDGPCQLLSNQLFMIENQGSTYKRIFRDSVLKTFNHTKIFLDWTEEEHRLYDSSYLKDLPDVYHKTGFTAKKTRSEVVSLFSCLDAFLREEPLGPDDMWYCPNCKEHRQATKKLDLWMLPEILVVHLKRFSYNRFLRNKLVTFVDFPIHNLDLSKYVKQKDSEMSCTYDLYAISNHYGGLGGGHYTAYAKLIDEDKWYNFDDSRVTPVNESDIKTSAAYVLFYRRVKPQSRVLGRGKIQICC